MAKRIKKEPLPCCMGCYRDIVPPDVAYKAGYFKVTYHHLCLPEEDCTACGMKTKERLPEPSSEARHANCQAALVETVKQLRDDVNMLLAELRGI